MEMEAGVTSERPIRDADNLVFLIIGLVTFVVGFTVLLSSSLGYLSTMNDMKSLKEKAEEMGLGDIPGVNLEYTARFFLILILIGGVLLIGGIALVIFAVVENRGMKGSGLNPRRSP